MKSTDSQSSGSTQNSLFKDLRFDIIQEKLACYCHCPRTEDLISGLTPSTRLEAILDIHNRSGAILAVLQKGDPVPLEQIPDISAWSDLLRIEGNVLPADHFFELKRLLEISGTVKQFCKRQELTPWREPAAELLEFKIGIEEIDRIFDDEHKVRSSASADLKRIRRAIEALQVSIQKRMQEIFTQAATNNWLHGDKIVFRDGRLALPCTPTHKRKIKGVVLGRSATGQTVFVEPLEIIEKNNELASLQAEEKAEVYRIMRALTAFFKPYTDDIGHSFQILLQFDLHYCLAAFAKQFDCVKPEFTADDIIVIRQGRNPQLALTGRTVIPLDLDLSIDQRILLLSGPNAGGKTVVLKTLGLFALMAQCGIFLPADKVILPVFDHILVDIGDQQSVENDLSTFSAHIRNVNDILSVSTERTLVLIDELGTGTDPDAGAALSRAVLERFLKLRSRVIATSHLGQLKVWAHETAGVVNGGMKFDPDLLAPTYELNLGIPGSSYALEISQRTGLEKSVIRRARELVGDSSVKLENLLGELEKEHLRVHKLQETLSARESVIRDKELRISAREQEINEKFNRARAEAANIARQIVENARRDTENLVENIKSRNADHQSVKKAKKTLTTKITRLKKKIEKFEERPADPIPRAEAVKGAPVRISHLGEEGIILQPPDKQDNVLVSINGIRIRLKLNQLSKPRKKPKKRPKGNLSGNHAVAPPAGFRLDLRGKRVDEALSEVTRFLDRALLAGLPSVQILHGKGTGALQEAVQEYLATCSFVDSYVFARPEQGGAGITVVDFK
ncbi:MAG: endonuclease MutS2 [FCB group bacterium]|nr:endonuclease MutS2 [FCB group bacterium]